MTIPGQQPLFDLPPDPPVRVPSRPRQDAGRPRWTRYTAKNRLPCDDCKLLQAQDPSAPLARQARMARTQGGERLLLCHAHAAVWRERDGLLQAAAP